MFLVFSCILFAKILFKRFVCFLSSHFFPVFCPICLLFLFLLVVEVNPGLQAKIDEVQFHFARKLGNPMVSSDFSSTRPNLLRTKNPMVSSCIRHSRYIKVIWNISLAILPSLAALLASPERYSVKPRIHLVDHNNSSFSLSAPYCCNLSTLDHFQGPLQTFLFSFSFSSNPTCCSLSAFASGVSGALSSSFLSSPPGIEGIDYKRFGERDERFGCILYSKIRY